VVVHVINGDQSHLPGDAVAGAAIVHLLVQGQAGHELLAARWHQRHHGAFHADQQAAHRQGHAGGFGQLHLLPEQLR